MTTTAASRQALGAYGETVAARLLTWPSAGMVAARPQLAVRRGRARPRAARRRRAGRLRGQDPARRRLRVAARGGRPGPSSSGCTGWCGAGPRTTTCGPRRCGSTWSPCCGHGAARPRRPRRGAGLMPFATTPHGLAERRGRPPHRRPGRRLARPGRHRARRAARRRPQRVPRPVPDGDPQQRARVAVHPPYDDPALARPTCPSAAPTTTWRSRSPCSAPPARCPRRASRASCFIGELTLAGGLRSVPRRAADGAGRRPARASATSWCPSRRPARPRWCRAWRCSGCARWPRSWPSCAASRCPRRRRWPRCPAAGCCPGAAPTASTRSTSPTWPAWRTPATPSRWPRPAATTCCCPGPRGRARPASPSGSPGCSPT